MFTFSLAYVCLLVVLIISGCQRYSLHMHPLKDTPTTSAKSNVDNMVQQLIVEPFRNLDISDIRDIFDKITGFTSSDHDKLKEIYNKWDTQQLSILLQQLHHKGLLSPDNFREIVNLTEEHPGNCSLFGSIVAKMYQRDFFTQWDLFTKGDLLTQQNLKDIMDAILAVDNQHLPAIELAFCSLFENGLLNQQYFSKIVGHKKELPYLCDLLTLLNRTGYLIPEILTDLFSERRPEYQNLDAAFREEYYYNLHTVIQNFLNVNPALLQPYIMNEWGLLGLFCYKELAVGLFPILRNVQIVRVLTQDNLKSLGRIALRSGEAYPSGGFFRFLSEQWTPGSPKFLIRCKELGNAVLEVLVMLLNNNLLTESTFQATIRTMEREYYDYGSRSNRIKRNLGQLSHANLLTQDNFQLLLSNNTIFGPIDNVGTILEVLAESRLLTQDIFQVIMEGHIDCYTQSSLYIKNIITQLSGANLATTNNVKLLLTARWDMQELDASIKQLKNVNLFTQDNLPLLLQLPAYHAGCLLPILERLSENNLLTQDMFQTLVDSLRTISLLQMRNGGAYMYLLTGIIMQLIDASLFTADNLNLLLNFVEYDSLCALDKKIAKIHRLTQNDFTKLCTKA